MFGILKKKEINNKIYAPVDGTCIGLEEVADEVFSSKMMGDGAAFKYEGSSIYSPCDGVVSMIAGTKHAIGLKANNGMEILLHVGLDTVNLNGKGFNVAVKQNQNVKVGDLLLTLEREVFEKAEIDITTPMIITNSSEFSTKILVVNDSVEKGKSPVIEKV